LFAIAEGGGVVCVIGVGGGVEGDKGAVDADALLAALEAEGVFACFEEKSNRLLAVVVVGNRVPDVVGADRDAVVIDQPVGSGDTLRLDEVGFVDADEDRVFAVYRDKGVEADFVGSEVGLVVLLGPMYWMALPPEGVPSVVSS